MTTLKIRQFHFNMFEVNTFVVYDATSRQAMIIDPGMITAGEQNELFQFIEQEQLRVKHIIHTHLHLDHIFGTTATRCAYPEATALAHSADFTLGQTLPQQAQRFHLAADLQPVEGLTPIESLDEPLRLAEEQIEVRHLPGHSPGGVALYFPSLQASFSGDSLFQGSIGRTDLPGGNHAQLIRSIEKQLFTLPDQTTIYPGHGPSTTVASEKQYNPYL